MLSLAGADMITFFAPDTKCSEAFSYSKKTPVDSQTIVLPFYPQGIFFGSLSVYTLTSCLPSISMV